MPFNYKKDFSYCYYYISSPVRLRVSHATVYGPRDKGKELELKVSIDGFETR